MDDANEALNPWWRNDASRSDYDGCGSVQGVALAVSSSGGITVNPAANDPASAAGSQRHLNNHRKLKEPSFSAEWAQSNAGHWMLSIGMLLLSLSSVVQHFQSKSCEKCVTHKSPTTLFWIPLTLWGQRIWRCTILYSMLSGCLGSEDIMLD